MLIIRLDVWIDEITRRLYKRIWGSMPIFIINGCRSYFYWSGLDGEMKGVLIKPLCFKENLVHLSGKRIKKSEIWYEPQPWVHTLSWKVLLKVWYGVNFHQHFEGRALIKNVNVSVPHYSCESVSLEDEGDKIEGICNFNNVTIWFIPLSILLKYS